MSKAIKNEHYTPDIHPIAQALCDELSSQIKDFLGGDDTDKMRLSKNIFKMSYPAHLNPEIYSDTEGYSIYQVERTTDWSPERKRRITTHLVVIDDETHRPKFYVDAFITQGDDPFGYVAVMEMGEFGPIYRNTLRWDSRGKRHKDKE